MRAARILERKASLTLIAVIGGGVGVSKRAAWISRELYRPARRTRYAPSNACHSSTEPGPMPSARRTCAGTVVRPRLMTLDVVPTRGF